MPFRIAAVILVLSLLAGVHFNAPAAQHRDEGLSDRTRDGRLAPLLANLGNYHRPVTTRSAEAQKYFDQGLILIYGFNHAEALRSFKETARIDPECAMAYWGQALALAPNINDPVIPPERETEGYEAIQVAIRHKMGATEVERGLIDALAVRFSAKAKPDRTRLNDAYAQAMRDLYRRYSSDPDVAALYADAVLNTMPWDYWTDKGTFKPAIAEAVIALEKTMDRYPDHPGAHHFYIHAVEGSNDPDRGIPSADKLGSLVPGAGHLVHMPSHIYIRVGRYADASAANRKAILADEDYITQCRAQGIYPSGYYPHNIHFLFATLSMEGRSREALEAARKVSGVHGEQHMHEPGFGFPHLLQTMPLFGMIRFARWDEVLIEPDPGDGRPFGQAIYHFARGLAFLQKNDAAAAAAELDRLRSAARHPELPGLKIFDQNDLASLSSIAGHLLAAELAAYHNKTDEAVTLARNAVALEDGLRYSEPPDWPVPARHFLGAILVRAGKYGEAEAVYREDLKRHRDNGWALYGLMQCLKAQKKDPEVLQVEQQFSKAWAGADFKITSSRM